MQRKLLWPRSSTKRFRLRRGARMPNTPRVGARSPSGLQRQRVLWSCCETATSRKLRCDRPRRGPLGAVFRKGLARYHHTLANDRDTDIARQVQQNLGQLLFGPALAECHAQMQRELGFAAGG